jgi:hypothetical protein
LDRTELTYDFETPEHQQTPQNNAVEQTSVSGGGAWMGVGTDCTLESTGRGEQSSDPNTVGECPHIAFGFPENDETGRKHSDFPYRHVGRLCDVEELTINGRGATPHPMHVHVNHFQIVEVLNSEGVDASSSFPFSYWGEVGDWRDTMPALAGRVKVRYMLDTFGGAVMSHCHFLPHEDMGMMDRFWVEPANSTVPRCTATSTTLCDTAVASGDYAVEAYDDAYPSITSDTCDEGPSASPVFPPTVSPTATFPPTAAPTVMGTSNTPGVVWVTLVVSVLACAVIAV